MQVSGIVLLDKASGITSNEALQQVKRLFNAKKAGHTGSLDPLATGLLPICLGEATKISQFLLNADKTYIVSWKFGRQTTTADSEGEVVKTASFEHIKEADLLAVLPEFLGHSKQVPPMYSAIKKDGKALYKLARAGVEISRKPRNIEIYYLNLIEFDTQKNTFKIKVRCSKGTYIRVLVEDIAKKLDTLAFTCALRRIEFAHFKIDQSVPFTKLVSDKAKLISFVLPTTEALPEYPNFVLDNRQVRIIQDGQSIINSSSQLGLVKLLAPQGDLFAIGFCDKDHIKPKRLLK